MLVQSGARIDERSLAELKELARSAGAVPVATVIGKRDQPDPRSYIGKGKLEELTQCIAEQEAELVLFNNPLSPSQERNLEKALQVRVLDRTGLILDIFAQRAQSYEGKLQVELAQLRHLSTRLVRGWTHLERQKGGIGLRGPGETQLETDKRLIGKRISQIQKRLEKVDKQREQGRRSRKRSAVPVVGLVGYTNAGKSTLINALTGASVYAADQLFATLDPALKRLPLGPDAVVILADTVGFVRDLPHELVAAFKSTLQETVQADLLLHVIDAGDEQLAETLAEVERVIEEIGAGDVPRIRLYNKIDRLENPAPMVRVGEDGQVVEIWLSALTGEGLELLLETLRQRFSGHRQLRELRLMAHEGAVRARLYRSARVLRDEVDPEGGWRMSVEAQSDHLTFLDNRPEAGATDADVSGPEASHAAEAAASHD